MSVFIIRKKQNVILLFPVSTLHFLSRTYSAASQLVGQSNTVLPIKSRKEGFFLPFFHTAIFCTMAFSLLAFYFAILLSRTLGELCACRFISPL